MKTIHVCNLTQHDDPCRERAKLQIAEWLRTTPQGEFLLKHYPNNIDLKWTLEPDGGMEPHWIIELSVRVSDSLATYYWLRWPDAQGVFGCED